MERSILSKEVLKIMGWGEITPIDGAEEEEEEVFDEEEEVMDEDSEEVFDEEEAEEVEASSEEEEVWGDEEEEEDTDEGEEELVLVQAPARDAVSKSVRAANPTSDGNEIQETRRIMDEFRDRAARKAAPYTPSYRVGEVLAGKNQNPAHLKVVGPIRQYLLMAQKDELPYRRGLKPSDDMPPMYCPDPQKVTDPDQKKNVKKLLESDMPPIIVPELPVCVWNPNRVLLSWVNTMLLYTEKIDELKQRGVDSQNCGSVAYLESERSMYWNRVRGVVKALRSAEIQLLKEQEEAEE